MKSVASSRRSQLLYVALIVIGVGLLSWVIWRNWADFKKVFANPVDYRLFGLGLAIYLVALITTFFRWHRLVLAQGLDFSIKDAVRLGFIGNVFNLAFPGGVGGDIIKAAFLGQMQPEKKHQGWASMILDRILGLLGLFLLASIAGGFAWGTASPQVRLLIAMVWCALLAGLTALAVAFSPGLYRPLNRLVAGRGKLEAAVRKLESIGLAYRERIGLVVAMLGVATGVHSLFVLAFYVASLALFGEDLPTLGQHFLMVPLVLFSTAVPIPFGAIGVVENVSSSLFQMVHHKDGAIAMLAFRVLMYGSGILSACVWLANLRQVQTLQADAEQFLDDPGDQTMFDPGIPPAKTEG
jgi:uncharacterized membrane protein YbhN (UPF0104 family)